LDFVVDMMFFNHFTDTTYQIAARDGTIDCKARAKKSGVLIQSHTGVLYHGCISLG
jgi:hypothetical protein